MNIADRLKQLRAVKGISQVELSGATELTPEQIAHIEETSDATIRELIEISTYFKADLNWFIMGAGYESLAMDYMVLIDSKVAAGYLENKDDPTYFSQLEYYRIPGFAKSGNHRIFWCMATACTRPFRKMITWCAPRGKISMTSKTGTLPCWSPKGILW